MLLYLYITFPVLLQACVEYSRGHYGESLTLFKVCYFILTIFHYKSILLLHFVSCFYLSYELLRVMTNPPSNIDFFNQG